MTLLSVVIAYLILRWWGAAKPLHHDAWFFRWCDWLSQQPALRQLPVSVLVFSLLGPVLLLLLLLILASSLWYWLQLIIAVPVLLYSVGRGKYSGLVMRYLRARHQRDWVESVTSWQQLTGPEQETDAEAPEPLDQDDWAELDQRMLKVVSYRGFERTFAVLFWFVLLGPAGALIYRLSALYLYRNGDDDEEVRTYARRWLWLLEWPAARVLGLSFAMTGNFVGCIQSWLHYLWSTEHSTAEVLRHYVLGALNVDEDLSVSPEATEREFKAALSLFSRTLIFWICVLAVITVLL
jgi:AmpE protein